MNYLPTSWETSCAHEHSDYRWITENTKNLHPFVREMIARSEIF